MSRIIFHFAGTHPIAAWGQHAHLAGPAEAFTATSPVKRRLWPIRPWKILPSMPCEEKTRGCSRTAGPWCPRRHADSSPLVRRFFLFSRLARP